MLVKARGLNFTLARQQRHVLKTEHKKSEPAFGRAKANRCTHNHCIFGGWGFGLSEAPKYEPLEDEQTVTPAKVAKVNSEMPESSCKLEAHQAPERAKVHGTPI